MTGAWLYWLAFVARNVLRHPLRTSLTVLGLVVAIVSFGLLRTVVDSWYAAAGTASNARLVTRSAIAMNFPLPASYAKKLVRVMGVSEVSWAQWFGGVYIDEHNFFPQFAIDAPSYLAMFPEYVLPNDQVRSFLNDRKGCVAGRAIAQKYGWKIGDQISLKGTIFPGAWTFNLRGIYQGSDRKIDETQFFFHWQYLDEAIRNNPLPRPVGVGVYFEKLSDPDSAAAVSAAIDEQFVNSIAETRTETQKSFQLGFAAMVDTIVMAIQSVSFVIIVIIVTVVANTIAMTVRERTSEYATLKALGFSNRVIGQLIFGESFAISIIGGLLGALCTFPVARAFHTATGSLFITFDVTPLTVALQIGAAAVIGLLAGVIPTLNAGRISIADGIRATA